MRRLLGIGFILWAFTACGSAVFQSEEDPEEEPAVVEYDRKDEGFLEFFFEALKHKALENYDGAIMALEKSLEINDSEAAVYHELGKIHHLKGNYDSAVKYLELAQKLVPDHQPVLVDLYQSYFLNGRFQQALQVIKKLSQLNENYKEDLANLYFLNEHFEPALEVLDELDQQWGYSDRRTGLRRKIYAVTDDVEGKIAELHKKITEEPREERHYLNLIFIYGEAGEPELAYETAQQLLKIDPHSELVHLALYKFYLGQNYYQQAMASVKTLLRGRELEDEVIFQVLNDFLLHHENHALANDRLAQVVEVFTQELSATEVYEEVGDFYLRRNELDRALEYYREALVEKISGPDLVIKALLLQTEKEAYQEVIELSRRGLEHFPTHPFLYLLQGTAFNGTGDHQLALDRLHQGLAHLDNDPELEVAFYEQMVVATRALGAVQQAAGYARNVARLKLKILDE